MPLSLADVVAVWYQCLACKKLFEFPEKLIFHKENTPCGQSYPYAEESLDSTSNDASETPTENRLDKNDCTSNSNNAFIPGIFPHSKKFTSLEEDKNFPSHEMANTVALVIAADENNFAENQRTISLSSHPCSAPLSTPHPLTPRYYMKMDHDYWCRYCFKQVETLNHLKFHLSLHIKKNDLHSCYFCGMEILEKDGYDRHMHSHTRERLYHCERCGMSFMNPNDSSKHKCEILNCEHCGKCFNKGRHMQSHIAENHTKNSAICTHSNLVFSDRHPFVRHTKRPSHLKKFKQLRNVYVPEVERGKGIQKGLASAIKFTDKEDLAMPKKERQKVTHTATGRPYCRICKRYFLHAGYLNLHLESKKHKLQALRLQIKKVKSKLERYKSRILFDITDTTQKTKTQE